MVYLRRTIMTVTGPSFIALQVRDLERSAQFYETYLGLHRTPQAPSNAVVFATDPIPFAVREPLPGVNLDEISRPAWVWPCGCTATMYGVFTRSSRKLACAFCKSQHPGLSVRALFLLTRTGTR